MIELTEGVDNLLLNGDCLQVLKELEDEIMKIIYIWQDISKKVSGDKLTLIRMNLGVFFNKFINPEEETLSFFVSDNLMDFFHKFRRDLYSKIKDLNSFK